MGYDRISELPDCLLTQILSNVTTKDSVSTSVLSKRWRNLWLSVPGLDLDDYAFTLHGQSVKRFMEFNSRSRIQNFKIRSSRCTVDGIARLIRKAVPLGLQYLDVEGDSYPCMPKNMYKSNTLVSLKLVTVVLSTPKSLVSLPCLKFLHLEDIWCEDEDPLVVDKLISGCHVLEDLTWIGPNVCIPNGALLLRVRSQTLKTLRLTFPNTYDKDCSVEIDAPRLEYLSFKNNQSEKIVIKNLSSLFKIEIDTEFRAKYGDASQPEEIMKRPPICAFLSDISCVRHMTISRRTIEVLSLYCNPIPKFEHLYRLQTASYSYMLPLLKFLESCPNLKYLVLDTVFSREPEATEFGAVPQCLLTSLECIEIRELCVEENTWRTLARYFLKNSVTLKKLILRFRDSSGANQDSAISKELRTFTKHSPKCQIIIHLQWH